MGKVSTPEVVISPQKKELSDLESTGEYVFHGTDAEAEQLYPQQAVDLKRGLDGAPAIFASSKVDYAIFMAIVNKKNAPAGTRSSVKAEMSEDGSAKIHFGATKETLDQIEDTSSGWVYVFNKNDFVPRGGGSSEGLEYVSQVATQPVRRIEVHKVDLPAPIDIIV